MRKLKFILYVLPLWFLSHTMTAQHATLVDVGFDCETSLGFAEFEINGNPSEYDYYWSNGTQTLKIQDVPSGIYTFYVTDLLGCLEEYEVGIFPNVDYVCAIEHLVELDKDNCKATIKLAFPRDDNTVTWEDGNTSGLVREVDVTGSTQEFCVTITANQDGCCTDHICIVIPGNLKACGPNLEGDDNGDDNFLNEVKVFPNPYVTDFTIEIKSLRSGVALIQLFDSKGTVELSGKIDVSDRSATRQLFRANSVPGIKLLKVEFPDGSVLTQRISQIK